MVIRDIPTFCGWGTLLAGRCYLTMGPGLKRNINGTKSMGKYITGTNHLRAQGIALLPSREAGGKEG